MKIHERKDRDEKLQSEKLILDTEFINEIRGWAYRRAFRATHNHEDAEDLSQEVLVAVLNSSERYDSAKSKPNTYVTRIIINKIKSFIKDRGRKKIRYDPFQDDILDRDIRVNRLQNPLDIILEKEMKLTLINAIESLSKRQKEVIRLTYSSGLSSEETGEILGISRSAVLSHLMVARRNIRFYLDS